jgi:hypothetical protein
VGDGGAATPAGATSPFEAFSAPAYVTKVKTMLTGLAPTLSDLVTARMALPAYTAKMASFFADAFQQLGAGDRVPDQAR